MPQLLVRGISPERMASVSAGLVEELADICGCPASDFTIDCLPVASVFGGKLVDTFPFIEVAWFDRGQRIRDETAAAIAKHLRIAGVEEAETAFVVYRKDSYYANGERCFDE